MEGICQNELSYMPNIAHPRAHHFAVAFATQAAEAQSQQQREQREADAAAATAAEASAAFEAGRAAAMALKAASKGDKAAGGAVGQPTASSKQRDASSSSSSSEGARGGNWSAGGFLEDASAVDSGSDDEPASYVLGSTDWGWQQLDEESQVGGVLPPPLPSPPVFES
jgi:hypothetical protein